MKFKLDENLGASLVILFKKHAHDVETVFDENLSGASDEKIYKTCCAEGRCLVTLDLDFSDPVRFQSERCGGIIVLRVPRFFTISLLTGMIAQIFQTLKTLPLNGKLWIVEPGRIRVHQNKDEIDDL